MTVNPPSVFLPDTNILIHHGRTDALSQRVNAQYGLFTTASQPILSIVIVGEIMALAAQNQWGTTRKQDLQTFINQCRVLPLEYPGIIDAYVELYQINRKLGRQMGNNDLWIAAAARVTRATLLTTDKDFDHLAPIYIARDWIDPTAL